MTNEKRPVVSGGPFFVLLYHYFLFWRRLNGNKADNFLFENHKNNVANPNNPKAEENADDARDNLALHKPCDKAENPRGNGNDRKDNADDVA